MQRKRIVEVLTDGLRGSGYLIADRLVLTAAHLLPRTGHGFGTGCCRVRTLDSTQAAAAKVRWARYDGPDTGVDAALLEITDQAWLPPLDLPPVRWGRVVGVRPGLPVQVVGFPDSMTGRLPDADQVRAVINPLSGIRSGRLQLTTEAWPERAADGSSLWAGISGGPVCSLTPVESDSLLLGTVVVHRLRQQGRLTAVPASAVLDDPGAAGVLRQHGLGEVRVASYEGVDGPPVIQATWATAMRTLPRDLSGFVGRDAELDRLTTGVTMASAGGQVIDIHAIGGMPGVGKTALAVHVGHRLTADFPDGQLFIPLHGHTPDQSPVAPSDALAALLVASGVTAELLPNGPDPQAVLDARSGMWRDRLSGKRVLLILDDAVDHRQVAPLLPNTPGSLVLITSRHRLAGLPGTKTLALDTLAPGPAVAMLCEVADRSAVPDEAAAAAEVVRLCGGLPLAISLVASRLRNHPTWTMRHLAADLTRTMRRLSRLAVGDVAVAAAFDLSYRNLPHGRQRFFRRLSLHPGTEVDASAAGALDGIDTDEADERLESLYNEHLLIESAPGRYRMHDLVREYAGALAEDDDPTELTQCRGRLFDHLQQRAEEAAGALGAPAVAGSPADTAVAARSWLETEFAGLLACARYCADHDQSARVIAFASALSGFLRFAGPWDQAVALHHTAAASAAAAGEPRRQIRALTDLALARRLIGDYSAAADDLRSAMAVAQEIGDRGLEARALNDLGAVFGQTGDYAATAEAHRSAVSIFREIGDPGGEASGLNYLGVVNRLTADYSPAAEELTRSAELFRAAGDQRGEAVALANLGIVHRQLGDYRTAAELVERALALSRQIRDRRGSIYILHALGVIRQLTGAAQAAREIQLDALKIADELGDRRGRVYSLNYLGAVLRLTGQLSDAAQAHQDALTTARALGDRRAQSHALRQLSIIHRMTGQGNAAESAAEKALTIATELGDRRGRVNALHAWGAAKSAGGDREAAIAAYAEALEITRAIGDRQSTAEILNSRGQLRLPTDPDGAISDHRRAQQLAAGLGNPYEEANALAGQARCDARRDRADAAAAKLKAALDIYRRIGTLDVAPVTAELEALRAE